MATEQNSTPTASGGVHRARPRPPIRLDDAGVPYVLMPGYPDVRLTPFDIKDGKDDEDCTTLWNDPMVGRWAFQRPWPYKLEHNADFWREVGHIRTREIQQVKEYVGAHPTPTAEEGDTDVPFVGWPFCALRYVPGTGSTNGPDDPSKADKATAPKSLSLELPSPAPGVSEPVLSPGPSLLNSENLPIPVSTTNPSSTSPTAKPIPAPLSSLGLRPGQVIGSLSLFPSPENGLTEEENLALPVKDRTYETAYDLLPVLHGRGLGRGLLKTLEGWGRWVGLGKICAKAQTDNPASSGLLKACGYKKVKEYDLEWPAIKGGGIRRLGWWELELDTVET